MKPLRDPERLELHHLLDVCSLDGKRVLEIGSGDGVFVRQYARMARQVIGIDPAESELLIAKKKARSAKTSFFQAKGENLPFFNQKFDIVLFASSL